MIKKYGEMGTELIFLIGVIGLGFTMTFNVVADIFFHPFSLLKLHQDWRYVWFACYAVWLVFLSVGLYQMYKSKEVF